MLQTNNNLKEFFVLSYKELEKKNLELKKERKEKREDEQYFKNKLTEVLNTEEGIKAVTVCFSDIEGKFLTLDYDKGFLLDSEGSLTFDGSSIRGFSKQKQSDLFLKVDWSSFRYLPSDIFGAGKVIVFANVLNQDGKPYESDFRGSLKTLTDELWNDGKKVANVAPEIEGFLVDGVDAEQNFNEETGFKLVTKGGYFNSLPQDQLRIFIDRVAEAKRAIGFENEKDHPEVAPSQFELNYKYADALEAADQIQIYKLICRQVAKQMGLTATFLPKPMMGINGSGMHTNISISDEKENLFHSEKKGEVSEYGNDFLQSILHYAKEICLILNPSVNSYRRLDPHYEAPNEIKVSPTDRGSMIRIPLIGSPKAARIEVRSAAPDCNPYLEIFTLLKVGMHGTKNPGKYTGILKKREKLPGNIYDAIRYFKGSKMIKEILGEENQEKFANLKEMVANRCPKDLGTRIKKREIVDHHEITNQYLWGEF